MRGRVGKLDKDPWTGVEPPEGLIERAFLRRVALGESIAPYRILDIATGVVPMDDHGVVLTATSADAHGHRGLAAWLHDAETKWNEHSNKKSDGTPRATLTQSLNHLGKLSAQSKRSPVRIIYPASGKRLSACWIEDNDIVIDKDAYWCAAQSLEEAAYVAALLNSDVVLGRIKDLQPMGDQNPRHFDNLVWTLPIPEFDPTEALHTDLAAAALHAGAVAASVDLPAAAYFVAKRSLIRQALAEDGVAETIERLVDALLPL